MALTTHAVDAVTDRDVDLAGEISALAAAAAAISEPTTVQALEVAIDAVDIEAVRRSGRRYSTTTTPPPSRTDVVVAIVDRLRIGPGFWFQQLDEPPRNATASTST